MHTETNAEKRDNQKLLKVLTVLLNVGVLIAAAFLGWSVYRLISLSTEIYNIINGSIVS